MRALRWLAAEAFSDAVRRRIVPAKLVSVALRRPAGITSSSVVTAVVAGLAVNASISHSKRAENAVLSSMTATWASS